MKAFLIGIVFLVIVGVAGFFGLKWYSQQQEGAAAETFKTEALTFTGTVQKSAVAGSDVTHVLLTGSESVGMTSYQVSLDDYIGKKVEVTGQKSGSTLYVDTITAAP